MGYSLPIIVINSGNPVASTTYYFGMDSLTGLSTTFTQASVMVLKAGTIKGAYLKARITTPGSAELATHSLRINDATDVLVATGAYNANVLEIANSSLSQAVAVGDTVVFKLATPAWVTPPVTVRWEGYIVIQ